MDFALIANFPKLLATDVLFWEEFWDHFLDNGTKYCYRLSMPAKGTNDGMTEAVTHINHLFFIDSGRGLEHWQIRLVLRLPVVGFSAPVILLALSWPYQVIAQAVFFLWFWLLIFFRRSVLKICPLLTYLVDKYEHSSAEGRKIGILMFWEAG